MARTTLASTRLLLLALLMVSLTACVPTLKAAERALDEGPIRF